MQRTRLLPFRKGTLLLVQKTEYQCAGTSAIDHLERQQYLRPFSTESISKPTVQFDKPVGTVRKILNKFGLLDINKYRTMVLGNLAYENIADTLNYNQFYKDFSMPDTMFSWFLVTELHVWMLMVRYMAEGKYGKFARNTLVESMWHDTEIRAKRLGTVAASIKRSQIELLSQQFNAAVIGYDEGILGDDKTLAGALWRRFFRLECNNPEQLEKLLIYVRKQVNILDKMSSQEVMTNPNIKWLDLRSVR